MRSVLAVLLLSGCLYSPHDYTGLACDADRPCPAGYSCVFGVCGGEGFDAGVTIPNGGFELGIDGWYATSADTAFEAQTVKARSGAQALRVYTRTVGNTLGVSLKQTVIPGVDAGQTWCMEAWVDRGTTTTPINFIARRYAAGTSDWQDVPGVKTDPMVAGWQRVSNSVTTVTPYDRNVNLRFSGDAVAGAEYFVDDVRAWVAAGTTCP